MYNHLSIYAFSNTEGLELLYSAKGFGKLQGALFGITKASRDNKLHSLSISALCSLEKQSARITKSQLEQYTLRNYPNYSIAYISAKADETLMQKFGITSLEYVNSLDRANRLELMLQHKEIQLDELLAQTTQLQDNTFSLSTNAIPYFDKKLFELVKGCHLAKRQQLQEDICILLRQQEYKKTQDSLKSNDSYMLEKFQDCLQLEELKSTLKGYSFEQVRNFATRLMADDVRCKLWQPRYHKIEQNIWDQALKDAATSKYDFTEARLKLGLHRCHMALEVGKTVLF